MMKNLIIAVAMLLSPLLAVGQGGRVTVTMDDAANSAISVPRSQSMVQGYRLCIFSDNAQTGRAAAGAAIAQLRAIVGGISAEVVYENPFFKAYAGTCLNRIEAARLLGRVRGAFPRAIIVGETFPISTFGERYEDVTSPEGKSDGKTEVNTDVDTQ